MAIRNVNTAKGNKTTTTVVNNEPEALSNIPESNPEHQSSPDGYHEASSMPGVKMYKSFEEAKYAASLVHLKPGEAHTEFYKDSNNEYHCVVAIGNLHENNGHLYLTDSGNEYSLDLRLDQMTLEITDLDKTVLYFVKDVSALHAHITEFENSVTESLNLITHDISTFEDNVGRSISNLNDLINNVSTFIHEVADRLNTQVVDLSTYVSRFDTRITENENNIVLINASISDIKEQLETADDNIDGINASISNINSSIGNINNRLNALDNNINGINENISNINSSIGNINNRLNANISDINASISNINSSIGNINNRLQIADDNIDGINENISNINSSIGNINNRLNTLNNNISNINASIARLNTSVNILESLQLNTTSQINEINIALTDVNASINNINSNISNINSVISTNTNDINGLKSSVILINNLLGEDERKILNISNNIIDINASINEIESELIELDSNVSSLSDEILVERNRNNRQDSAIGVINSSIEWILETMRCKCADIQKEIERNNIQDVSIANIYSLIDNIQAQIDAFTPIEDSKIYPLFRDDIYTINLCCYSYGGHIEINDYIAGYEQGGHSNRVAGCTPFNEYKTYVHGDTVYFDAIPNPGYRFVCWYVNGNIDLPIYNQHISYTFGDDINVIGSLLDGIEPDMLINGYTAKFKKLHQLKVSINQITNDPNAIVQYFNDTLEIYITEPNQIRQKINIEDALAGNVYYDDGSKILVIAKPDADASHSFTKYIISDGIHTPEEYGNATYTNFNTTTDLIIDSYFMEYWITVSGAETPQYAGRIYINGNLKQIAPDNTTYYLGDSEVTISANSNNGYGFNKWSTNSNKPSLTQFKRDINPYKVTDNLIKLKVNKSVTEYELVAYFDSGVNRPNAYFYTDDSYEELFVRILYNDGDIVYAPENTPTKPGYTFIEWQCEDNTFILGESEIYNDLRFYAIWQVNTYDVSFFSKGTLYEELQNIEYNTPFTTLGVYYPDNISTGETFMGWMVDSYVIDPSTYHIQGHTVFDASIVLNTYNVTFIVDGNVIQNSTVEHNTLLSDIKPIDPEIDGYVFKWWSLNNESVDDNYQVQQDASFIAIFNNE